MLDVGNALRNEERESVFAFRLHQFLAAGGTVYATLESSEKRQLSLEGQYYAAGDERRTAAVSARLLPGLRSGILHGGLASGSAMAR